MTRKSRKGKRPSRHGSPTRRLIVQTMLVQAVRPSPKAWEKWVAPIYRNNAEVNKGKVDAPKIAILLRGWPHKTTAWLASALREQLLTRAERLPMNESQSLTIDYFGYEDNPYPGYKSWFEINLLTHPEVTARNGEIVWLWAIDTVMRAIHRLANRIRVLAPANDSITREAASKWRVKVNVWPEKNRRHLEE